MAKTVVVGDRSLHAKSVKMAADPGLPVLAAIVSKLGRRYVHRLEPLAICRPELGDGPQWSWRSVVATSGDDTVSVSDTATTRARWDLAAFVVVGVDGEPVMQEDGTGRTARELAAEWLGCDVVLVDALLGEAV